MRRVLAAGVVTAALLAATTGSAGATASAHANRLAGADRYLTARAIAESTFADSQVTVAVLASGSSYPDALAASFVAGLTGGPVLLTSAGSLPPGIDDTLKKLGVSGIQVVGGTAAVSDAVVTQLQGLGYVVDRLAGPDRYSTARAVATKFQDAIGTFRAGKAAIVATGTGFADALAAGTMSYFQGLPILLTTPQALQADARAALEQLGIEQAIVVGGTTAVSDAAVSEIRDLGITADRIAGATRQATARQIAESLVGELKFTTTLAVVANPTSFPDALAGGARGGHLQGPVLLADSSTSLGSEATAFLSAHTATISEITVLGGTSAISNAVADAAVAAARP